MLSYFYGQQADQFTFYRIPKVLFTDSRFRNLSPEAKTLYGILLDRMNLSARNNWLDEEGRVYIIYTIEEIMADLSCGNKKAVSLLTELTKVGLIERRRQGLGKPNLIYVGNFITSDGHFQKCENDTSGRVEMTFSEVSKEHGNNTDSNNTEYSNIYPSFPSADGNEEMEVRENYRLYFRRQFDYGLLILDHRYPSEDIDEIIELLVEVCCSHQKRLRVAGDWKAAEVVKSQLMKLEAGHIQYVLDSIRKNTTDVKNMKQYLLTALYNAPLTINNHASAKVNHDLALEGG